MAHRSKYLEVVDRLLTADVMDWGDYVAHIEIQNSAPPVGPALGSCCPDIRMRDQEGNVRDFASLAGPEGLLIVLVRSVHWCGYCRNQVNELNASRGMLAAAGVGIAVISPDPHDIVAQFAVAQTITIPILTDPDAQFCERIGLLNTNVAGSSVQYDGRIPFPAHILVARDGTIIATEVVDDLRHRPTANALVMEATGIRSGQTTITLNQAELSIALSLSSTTVHAGQEIAITLELEIAPGWHIYGNNDHGRYTPLNIHFDDDLLACQYLAIPEAPHKVLEGSGELAAVHSGTVIAHGRLRLAWSPPVHGSRHLRGLSDRLAQMQTPPGEHRLCGAVQFQACSADTCTPPRHLPFEFAITVLGDVESPSARAWGAKGDDMGR